jgi:hypothetical protein
LESVYGYIEELKRKTGCQELVLHNIASRAILVSLEIQVVVAILQSQTLKKNRPHCTTRGDTIVVFGNFGPFSRAVFW